MTPEEEVRLKQLETEEAERKKAEQEAGSQRLDEIADALRESGYPEAADRVYAMTNLQSFFEVYRGPLRRDIRDSNLDLADELDEERDKLRRSTSSVRPTAFGLRPYTSNPTR